VHLLPTGGAANSDPCLTNGAVRNRY